MKGEGRRREMSDNKGANCVIQIFLDEKGQVSVFGPLEQKAFTLGLLELAKSAVLMYNPEQGGRILKPEVVNIMKGGGKIN